VSLIGMALVLGPAAGAAHAGVLDYGATVDCGYEVTSSSNGTWAEALLRKLVVGPPTMPKPDRSQTVGWRFIVKRSMDARDNYPYVAIYRSPLQRALKTAGFSPMKYRVTIPREDNTPNGRRFVSYQVVIKMFWYAADGSVVTKKSHLMENMDWIMDGEEQFTDIVCPAKAMQNVDGE
jgi:hypothetical protein